MLARARRATDPKSRRLFLRRAYQIAANSLIDYATVTMPGYQTSSSGHLTELSQALMAVEAGQISRLMVFEPPRFGKSELAAIRFPTWYLGRHPKHYVVCTSYAESLAITHSRRAREIYNSNTYARIFPATGKSYGTLQAFPKQAAAEWYTGAGGGYYAVGIGGGLTGRGADLALIDDPYKDRQSANSETIRRNVMDWYRSTLYTRLSPTGKIVLFMTRWHPEDMGGTLRKEMENATGDKWTVIELPAIDPDGQSLWAERWPIERLRQIERAIGKYEWSALYMQQPTVRGGNILKTDIGVNVHIHTDPRDFPSTKYSRIWDLASTAKQRSKDDPDFTVGALAAITQEKDSILGQAPHIWVKDCIFMQAEAPARNRAILNAAERDGPGVNIVVEDYGAYKDSFTTLRDLLRGLRIVKAVHLPMDKLAKVSPAEPIFEAGHVHLLDGPWVAQWLKQHTEFTGLSNAGHDDAVDTTGILVQMHHRPTAGIAHPGLYQG